MTKSTSWAQKVIDLYNENEKIDDRLNRNADNERVYTEFFLTDPYKSNAYNIDKYKK